MRLTFVAGANRLVLRTQRTDEADPAQRSEVPQIEDVGISCAKRAVISDMVLAVRWFVLRECVSAMCFVLRPS